MVAVFGDDPFFLLALPVGLEIFPESSDSSSCDSTTALDASPEDLSLIKYLRNTSVSLHRLSLFACVPLGLSPRRHLVADAAFHVPGGEDNDCDGGGDGECQHEQEPAILRHEANVAKVHC